MTNKILHEIKWAIGKVDYIGNGRKNNLVEVEIKISEKEKGKCLSIVGSIWNNRMSDIYTGGQIQDTLKELFPDNSKVQRLVEIWDRWHLNDINAGCEHQRKLGWGREQVVHDGYKQWTGHLYESQHPKGVLCKPCPECGYKYGTQWLYEKLPQEIIDELLSMTNTNA